MGAELGRSVQRRREELGLTRREFAERSEISYPYVSQIETGEREPSLRTLSKLAEALELPVQSLASTVSASDWAAAPPMVSAPPDEKATEKVLASVERRLQALDPLERLQVLAELTARAAREAGGR